MTSVLQLGVGVVLLFTVVVVVPAASQDFCRGVPHQNYGCQTYILASPAGRECKLATLNSPKYSFYLRPGPTFVSLTIKLTWHLASPIPIYIGRNVLDQPDRWYRIQMTSDKSYVNVKYYVNIDGQEWQNLTSTFRAYTFDIYTRGSPFYAPDCDPSDYPPPQSTPPPAPAAPSPPTTPSPVQSTDDAANLPGVDLSYLKVPPPANTTENGEAADEHSSTEDGSKSEDATNLPWHTWVLVGAIVDVMIDIIALVALVIMTRKKWEKQTASQSQVTSSVVNMAFSEARMWDKFGP